MTTPIALFVYNRPHHTERTLTALKENDLAQESELFVFSDAPKAAEHAAGVQQVRKMVASLHGFRRVTVFEAKENRGCADSIIAGTTRLVNEYGQVIVLEDDLVTSRHFLRYMNDALEFYRDDERVISIHAYLLPVKKALPETFFVRGADCWGWATWKRGWDLFESDGRKLMAELRQNNLIRQFNRNNSYPYFKMLENQVAGVANSWAIRWSASAFLKDKLTLHPGRSLVHNIGNAPGGTNVATRTDAFDVRLSTDPIRVESIAVEESQIALQEMERFFRSLPFKWVAAKFRDFVGLGRSRHT